MQPVHTVRSMHTLMPKKRTESFKKTVVKDYEDYIEAYKDENQRFQESMEYYKRQIELNNKYIEILHRNIEGIDGKMAVVEEELAWLEDNGFARLDGRIAKAVIHRGLSELVNLKKRPTKLVAGAHGVQYEDQYWCVEWFAKIWPSIPLHKRSEFYETLKELENDLEELEKQIGLWLLNGI